MSDFFQSLPDPFRYRLIIGILGGILGVWVYKSGPRSWPQLRLSLKSAGGWVVMLLVVAVLGTVGAWVLLGVLRLFGYD